MNEAAKFHIPLQQQTRNKQQRICDDDDGDASATAAAVGVVTVSTKIHPPPSTFHPFYLIHKFKIRKNSLSFTFSYVKSVDRVRATGQAALACVRARVRACVRARACLCLYIGMLFYC